MADSKLIRVSSRVDTKAGMLAGQLGLSKKKLVEEAVMFFVRHKLSPLNFSPSADFDLSQLVMKSTERILCCLRQQEEELLPQIGVETLRTQLAVQALMNLVVDLNVPPAEQEEVAQRLENYIRQGMEKLEQHAHQGNQPIA